MVDQLPGRGGHFVQAFSQCQDSAFLFVDILGLSGKFVLDKLGDLAKGFREHFRPFTPNPLGGASRNDGQQGPKVGLQIPLVGILQELDKHLLDNVFGDIGHRRETSGLPVDEAVVPEQQRRGPLFGKRL